MGINPNTLFDFIGQQIRRGEWKVGGCIEERNGLLLLPRVAPPDSALLVGYEQRSAVGVENTFAA